MNNDMKCPFCQQELKYDAWNEVYMCRNPNCKHLLGFGTKELWQELIRTRKALDVAVDALNKYEWDGSFDHNGEFSLDMKEMTLAHKALEQITALEQKDK